VLNAIDLLKALFSWEALKRTLDSGEAKIENIGDQYRPIPAATLQPEAIPIHTKVILIGNPFIYYLLYSYDDNFRKLFKIKADFNWEMDRNIQNINKYAAFISARCSRDHILKHFNREAVARVVEFSSRLADNQNKLSAKFIEIDNIISEASYWADADHSSHVSARHVQKSIDEKKFRSNLIEEKIQESIEEGTIMIEVNGRAVGRVNGLSVYDFGDYDFGKPSRITCETFVGRGGVINIEREAKLAGKIHNKGVIILSGYLGGKYGIDKLMAMSATVGFAQSYEEIEGDSASSAELYAIISSLADIPLKQCIAVTGSVNQKGEIQPIGGVNQKIEGFFDICVLKGLNGDQGVIIPRQNRRNLMLKNQVIKAVADGMFHIWPINNIDEGIEILTGRSSGVKKVDGSYPKDSVHWLVNERLEEFGRKFKESSGTLEPQKNKEAA
ncbi:MAG TPA: ATP-dependent protease, partial [Actinobacteria bacterium]|nr:ATP-dependent protease [Actinomycetes bacterium]HEX21622.1 ATP-dependent protease [Actinomycetota bacterium]